jgi:predicted nucleic-acid-binding Zn-ribbon protein
MAVKCLRCGTEINKYRHTWVTLPIEGQADAYQTGTHALVACDSCGHFEFVHKDSALLHGMERIPTISK